MERWAGRVAMVTGASSGIGAGIAEELVKKGLKVVGLARRVERVEELSSSLKSETGKLFPLKCDVSKEKEVKEAFQWIKSNLGGVDILVNNAGICSHNTLVDGSVDSWKEILDLNVLGLSICSKEAIASMKEKGVDDGHIININSTRGHYLLPAEFGVYMYTASKHAVGVLTEGLRRELVSRKSKIRVTSLSPGLVNTEMIPEKLKEFPDLQPKDIADAVLFILGAPAHVQVHELTIRPVGDVI